MVGVGRVLSCVVYLRGSGVLGQDTDTVDPFRDADTFNEKSIIDAQRRHREAKEIERSKRAAEERMESGFNHGRPPVGLRFTHRV